MVRVDGDLDSNRCRTIPDAFEAVEVGVGHVVVSDLPKVEDGGVGGADAVDVGVGEDLVVCAIDRRVEDGLVEPDLDPVHLGQWSVENESVADLG